MSSLQKIAKYLLTNQALNQVIQVLIKLLPISHEIYKTFDDGIEVRCIFLNILKEFDKV